MGYSKYLTTVFMAMGLMGASSCLAEAAKAQGAYVGLFGGAGWAASASLQQRGAVHLNHSLMLPINARGSTSSGVHVPTGGAHAGYEWNHWNLGSAFGLAPGLELEGVYLGKHSPTGTMPVIPRALGTQYVTIPMSAGVFLANAVFTIQTPYSSRVHPYFGVGAGVALTSIKGSDSANPSEPGINHFNSDPDASSSAFAMQIKAGLKGRLTKNLSLFAEYRYLSVSPTSYTFGSTDYPGLHLPTTRWHVNLGRQQYNLFTAGLQYKF